MIATAIEIDPLQPEPHHTKRKVFFDEGKSDTKAAVADTTAETIFQEEVFYKVTDKVYEGINLWNQVTFQIYNMF